MQCIRASNSLNPLLLKKNLVATRVPELSLISLSGGLATPVFQPLVSKAHHAIFVGTTIVVCRDDGRRSSNDPLTPRDGRRLTAHTTRRPTTVEADNAPGRYSTFC